MSTFVSKNFVSGVDIVSPMCYYCLTELAREVKTVNENERRIAESLAVALEMLPDSKKEFLLGYAEGVAAMAARREADNGTGNTRLP